MVVDEGQAKLNANGHLQVRVKGLVIDPDDDEAGDLAWKNPAPAFKARLSCIIIENGSRDVVNLKIGTVPSSEAEDAEISEILHVPEPCYCPIVFVTSPGESWFSATGTR